jgi:hypothetical protein
VGSEADEAALLDTRGDFGLYVKCDATRGDTYLYRVVPADVARPGDQMDLVDAPNATAVEAIQSGLSTFDGDLSALATLTALDDAEAAIIAAYQQAAGAGANTVTVTLTDDNGDPVPSVWIKATAGGQSYWAKTSTSGVATFLLDDGDYTVWPASSATYIWAEGAGYYEGTVSGDTALAFEAELLTLPAPSAPTLCACYLDIRALVGGAAIAEGTGWLQITQQRVPGFPETGAPGETALARLDTVYTSDATGRIAVEIVRGTTVSLLAGVGAGPTGGNTERRRASNVVIPDAPSYDLTQASWS